MKALGLVRDLFFRSKIDAVARVVGAEVIYASALDGAIERCEQEPPQIVFADLSDGSFAAGETAARIRAAAPAARLIGFASHVDLKALNRAREAGFELALSREEFTARLPELLRPSGKAIS